MEQPSKLKAASAARNREAARDSLLLVAVVRRATGVEHDARVRNVSAGGMMADCAIAFARDEAVVIVLRGIGEVGGRVAWADGVRIGVAFDHEIDPKRARKPVGGDKPELPHFMKTAKSSRSALKPRERSA